MKCSMNGSNGGNGLSLSWCNISCFLKTASLVVIAWSLYDIANNRPHGGELRERIAERGDGPRGGGPRQ
jgi:hypothetical protein